MKIENKIITVLNSNDFKNVDHCHIVNSVVDTIDFLSFEAEFPVTIENCIIKDLLIHTCWFRKGLLFTGNHVTNYIDYQMGGHNEETIIFRSNIFAAFFNFFDCHFLEEIKVERNIFLEGTNLLGNLDTGYKNRFAKGYVVSENIGALNLDQ